MELGLALDDDDLGQTRNRTSVPILTSFNAKICTPLWFESEAAATDVTVSENNSQLLKFNGDYSYHQGRYEAACDLYIRSLAVLPSHSQATRLDLRQSLARCYLKLGQVQQAEEIANNLENAYKSPKEDVYSIDLKPLQVNTAQNIDHKKQSLILKLEVAMAMKKWAEAESCLHFLISQQPHFTHFWLQLAHVCHQMEPDGDVGQEDKLITCYVRARLLLESTMAAVSEVIRQRDQLLLYQVDGHLEELRVSETVLGSVTEFLRFDLKQERGKESGRQNDDDAAADAGSDVTDTNTSPQSPGENPDYFYTRWCGWVKSAASRERAAPLDT